MRRLAVMLVGLAALTAPAAAQMWDEGHTAPGPSLGGIAPLPTSCPDPSIPPEGSGCCAPTDDWCGTHPECQAAICGIDPFCCCVQWDQICADEAAQDPICAPCCYSGGANGTVDPCYGPGVLAASSDLPFSIWAADLDGDGDVDLLVPDYLSNKLFWSRNVDGKGSFVEQPPLDTDGLAPRYVMVASLDPDGDGDVLVAFADSESFAHSNDRIAWFENLDGAGTFGELRVISYELGDARALFAADIDGDGDTDALSASSWDYGGWVAWYENTNGFGEFGLQQVISSYAAAPLSLVAADLDGDGDQDVVVAFDDNKIRWHENVDGAGTFGPEQPVSAAAVTAGQVAAADVDGDDALDVLCKGGDTISWFRNLDGAGTFGPQQVISNAAGSATSLFAADLDGDGDLDVTSTSVQDHKVAWYRNLGGGAFSTPLVISYAGENPTFAFDADVDGDGDIDVIAADSGTDQVEWFETTCADCNSNNVTDDQDLDSHRSHDCNADGVPDECESDCNGNGQQDECDVHLGVSQDCTLNLVPDECEPDCNRSGKADSCDILSGMSGDCGHNGVPNECEPDCNRNGQPDDCDTAGGASEDCNGNAVPDECDLSSGTSQDCDGNRVPDECQLDCDADGVPDACELPDCNANGVPDNCDAGVNPSVDCNANGIPDECEPSAGGDCDANDVVDACDTVLRFESTTVTTGAAAAAVADVDTDGDLDVLAVQTGHVKWYRQLCPGAFGGPTTIATVSSLDLVEAADLDGDHDEDVIAVACTPGGGSLTWFANPSWSPHSLPSQCYLDVAPVDLDADGDLDLATAGVGLQWHENVDGFGSFVSHAIAGGTPTKVVAADVDGDGDADLVTNQTQWYENLDGAGQFGASQGIGGVTLSIFASDLDGDGDLDLAATTFYSVVRFENLDGSGSFGPFQIITTSVVGAKSVAATDIDGDGDQDVLSASDSDDKLALYENDGSGTLGPQKLLAEPAHGPIQVLTADVDADGDQDVLSVSYFGGYVLYVENLSDDCNGNDIPDACEANCDGDGIVDECALRDGIDVDCNANLVPDDCEGGRTDTDGDRCADSFDANPTDPGACADSDADGCDDCASGTFDPGHDGIHSDGDGICDAADCDPLDAAVWMAPGPAQDLRLADDGPSTALTWQPPEQPGAAAVRYDLLRSTAASDFHDPAVCLESDGADTTAADAQVPPSSGVFYYLVRVENDCPGAPGAMGSDSSGTPHTGRSCP